VSGLYRRCEISSSTGLGILKQYKLSWIQDSLIQTEKLTQRFW